MRRFKPLHGLCQFVQKLLFRFFLGANRFLSRSLDQASDAPGILVMSYSYGLAFGVDFILSVS